MSSATVTLLFCDLARSTELQSQLGDESTDDVRRPLLELLGRAATSAGGRVVKTLGDGLMASFTSAASALESAEEMQRSTRRLSRRLGVDLHLRVGISLGEVAEADGDWFGTPVVEAARLCDAASSDQILASDLVLRVLSHRATPDAEPVGPLQLKGFPEPLAAFAIPWTPDGTGSPDITAPLTERLVAPHHGCERELEVMADAWSKAMAGEVSIVLLEGDSGAGKTTLVAHAAASAAESGGRVLYGGCERDTELSYGPFAEALGPLIASTSPRQLAQWLGSDTEVLRPLHPAGARGRRLGRPGDSLTGFGPDDRQPFFDAVARLLAMEASVQPVLLILDDVQWATSPTLAMLRHLLRSRSSSSLTVVVSFRLDEPGHDDLLRALVADSTRWHHHVEHLRLTGLGLEEARAMASDLGGGAIDDGVLRRLVEATGGNAFFLQEMIRHVSSNGDVEDPLHSLPESVRAAILQRATTVGADARRVLDAAAVIGREVPIEVLTAVADIEDARLADALDELAAARLLQEQGSEQVTFSHDLVRTAIAEALGPVRRKLLHRRTGRVLAAHADARGVSAALVATHLFRGLDASVAEETVQWSLRAGRAAQDDLAFEDAALHLDRALEASTRLDGPRPALSADLRLARAEVFGALGDAEQLHRHVRAAADDARTAADPERLATAALLDAHWVDAGVGDPVTAELLEDALDRIRADDELRRAQLLAALSEYQSLSAGDPTLGLATARRARQLAEHVGDDDALAGALSAHAVALIGTPQLEERLAVARRLDDLVDDSHPAKVSAVRAIAHTSLELGRADDHAAAVVRLARLGEERRWWSARLWASIGEGCRSLLHGDLGRAEELLDEVERAGAKHPTMGYVALVQRFALEWRRGNLQALLPAVRAIATDGAPFPALEPAFALALVETGHPGEAQPLAERLLADDLRALPRDQTWTGALATLAMVCARLQLSDAAPALRAALGPHEGRLVVVGQGVACLGAVDRYLAMACQLDGDAAGATAHRAIAETLERRVGADPASFDDRSRVEEART